LSVLTASAVYRLLLTAGWLLGGSPSRMRAARAESCCASAARPVCSHTLASPSSGSVTKMWSGQNGFARDASIHRQGFRLRMRNVLEQRPVSPASLGHAKSRGVVACASLRLRVSYHLVTDRLFRRGNGWFGSGVSLATARARHLETGRFWTGCV